MHIRREEIVALLVSRELSDRAEAARRELPPVVDLIEHRDLLERWGVSTGELILRSSQSQAVAHQN